MQTPENFQWNEINFRDCSKEGVLNQTDRKVTPSESFKALLVHRAEYNGISFVLLI